MRTSASGDRPIEIPPKRSKRSPASNPPPRVATSQASVAAARPPGPTWCTPVASGAGAVVRRSSRKALLATQNRNRYRTARKPNFSATAIGSVSIDGLLLDVEDEPGRPQGDLVPGCEPGPVDASVVDLDAVGRAQVHDLPVAGGPSSQLRVLAGDVGVGDHAVAIPRAAEHGNRAVEHVSAIVQAD